MKGKLVKLSDENELTVSHSKLAPAETPTGTKPPPPLEPDAPEVDAQSPDGDEGWQPP